MHRVYIEYLPLLNIIHLFQHLVGLAFLPVRKRRGTVWDVLSCFEALRWGGFPRPAPRKSTGRKSGCEARVDGVGGLIGWSRFPTPFARFAEPFEQNPISGICLELGTCRMAGSCLVSPFKQKIGPLETQTRCPGTLLGARPCAQPVPWPASVGGAGAFAALFFCRVGKPQMRSA